MIGAFRSMSKIQKEAVVNLIALIACLFFVLGWAANGIVKHEAGYREKVNFCHDRMNDGTVQYIWRQKYCPNKSLDAVDPISGKPVAGIIERE